MKIQIRNHVFETNSSSVHSLCICSKKEYEDWKLGYLVYDINSDKMEKIIENIKPGQSLYTRYLSYPQYNKFYNKVITGDKEKIFREYTTEHGDHIVIFGYRGEWR